MGSFAIPLSNEGFHFASENLISSLDEQWQPPLQGQIHAIPLITSLRLSVPFDCADLFNLQNSCRPETFLLNSVRADFLSGDEKPVCRNGISGLQVTGNETYVKILENRIPDRDGCVREQRVSLFWNVENSVFVFPEDLCCLI
ncbi:hypothetical protein CDAR_101881 [Caerostris darwini]|uniref:Uncharacterized protein n=1 Tax=Caerostris darwini TaxID=1538125 RepID=A0AAV4TCB7_9ARAC|nr:hypothetical protein CDAR_101881 [Caerostris darwini]